MMMIRALLALLTANMLVWWSLYSCTAAVACIMKRHV
uniref:Uncharacterized protein n=1 Tax=Cryptococcus bacillisporus CA1280 TaxID=1296109 RepID=A0A0D0VEN2_CRYGA|nr:hypothetical protein I312_04921 [Cryptococcus bacillisporus CA1280]